MKIQCVLCCAVLAVHGGGKGVVKAIYSGPVSFPAPTDRTSDKASALHQQLEHFQQVSDSLSHTLLYAHNFYICICTMSCMCVVQCSVHVQ